MLCYAVLCHEAGTASYPPRECEAADRRWEAAPTVAGAPCCHNGTLVTASIAMVSLHEVEGRTHASLDELLRYYEGRARAQPAGAGEVTVMERQVVLHLGGACAVLSEAEPPFVCVCRWCSTWRATAASCSSWSLAAGA